MEDIIKASEAISQDIIKIRRHIHSNPGIGFDVGQTTEYVKKELERLGIPYKKCGKAGIVAYIGKRDICRRVLLRADMDALEIAEQSKEPFASKNGYMHACGHDMHTSMLLGASRILKGMEKDIDGCVMLMFQPAEEILSGAKDMIDGGLLDADGIKAAVMIHVMTGIPVEAGSVIVAPGGVSAPAAAMFEINVNGKGCHGAMPEKGLDPLLCAAHITSALCTINARELAIGEKAALTIGSFNAGSSANVIPDTAHLQGSLRAFSDDTFERLKGRICEIATGTAEVFRTQAQVRFTSECPTLINDASLSDTVHSHLTDLLGKQRVIAANDTSTGSSGSEDFAYVSRKLPSVMIALAAGDSRDGYVYPLHHPKVIFDERALSVGAAVYAYTAIKLLEA